MIICIFLRIGRLWLFLHNYGGMKLWTVKQWLNLQNELYAQCEKECSVIADLVKRHAGVLGLSACILSSPYDVPTWMPQLLMDLSAHLNDPQPIEVETLSLCVSVM